MTLPKAQPEDQSPPPVLAEFPNWVCLCLMAGFSLAIFSDVLFVHPREVLSDPRMDLRYFFVHWRSFGFNELKAGNLVLWDPHCSSGGPFFGNFQSALLYPLNFLYLLLPLEAAINWTIALHVFLGGVFTFYWMRYRGLHALACLLAGLMFMFCGPHFLQVHAGHLPNLCTLIWAPLLFLAIDMVVDGPSWGSHALGFRFSGKGSMLVDLPSLGPCLLGMFATAMAVYAGHPQFVFYLAVAVAVYCGLNLLKAERRGRIILGLAAIGLGAVALSAVQLFTGLQESGETTRNIGMSYEFATSYSFPPENFLTLLMPWFFGDMKDLPYWGRWYITETSVFVSVTGFVLAMYGMICGKPAVRRFLVTMLVVAFVLALGGYTPLFKLLFYHVPGFNMFRGNDKFLWLAALFLSALAAIGMDRMLRGAAVPLGLAAGTAGLGVVLCLLALLPSQVNWWARVVQAVPASGASTLLFSGFHDSEFITNSSRNAIHCLLTGGLYLFVIAALLVLARSRRDWACLGALMLAAVELVSFANTSMITFPIAPVYSEQVTSFLKQHPGDYRIMHYDPNASMTEGTLSIEGDDPSELLRYRRFLSFAEGFDFDSAPYGMPAQALDPKALRLLRYRYYFPLDERSYSESPGGLPQLSLVNRFRVMTNYHEMFTTLTNKDFNLEQEVILESLPDPAPQAAATEKGTVKLLASSTDYLEIEADAKGPELLFITDAYSRGWRARALPGSTQERYEVMPADYCLRAIPLAAGHHHLRVEYSPSGFRIGRVVSIVALAAFLLLTAWVVKSEARKTG